MIIIRLMGGLGNQLFQYALGRSLQYRHGYSVKYDRTILDDDPIRSYGLDRFNTRVEFANSEELEQFLRNNLIYFQKKLDMVRQRLRPYHRRRVIIEQMFGFDPKILDVSDTSYLIGYWQSHQYFEDIEEILHADLRLITQPDKMNRDMLNQIKSVEAVSMHVRRTDYLSNPKVGQVMTSCDLDYYQSAADYIACRNKDVHIFIFSDDPIWVQENMSLKYPVTFVSHNGFERDFEDLRLMSNCKHHVLANSSFSWWGAWICDQRKKFVIAPRQWFKDPRQNARHRLPDGWIRL